MGLWDRFRTEKSQKSLLELWERTEILEREMKNLKLEWNNTYDKLNTMMARTARRAEKMHELAENDLKLAPDDSHALTASEMLAMDRLGPAQRRIQMQILMRRKAANGGGGRKWATTAQDYAATTTEATPAFCRLSEGSRKQSADLFPESAV